MQIGDVVYLKSGSLPMTLVSQEGKNWVVQWSRGSDLTTANIPESALTATDPGPMIRKAQMEREAAVNLVIKPVAEVVAKPAG